MPCLWNLFKKWILKFKTSWKSIYRFHNMALPSWKNCSPSWMVSFKKRGPFHFKDRTHKHLCCKMWNPNLIPQAVKFWVSLGNTIEDHKSMLLVAGGRLCTFIVLPKHRCGHAVCALCLHSFKIARGTEKIITNELCTWFNNFGSWQLTPWLY